jgi:hypothetical protein
MSLRHVVLLKFVPEATQDQKELVASELRKLPSVIPQIRSYEVCLLRTPGQPTLFFELFFFFFFFFCAHHTRYITMSDWTISATRALPSLQSLTTQRITRYSRLRLIFRTFCFNEWQPYLQIYADHEAHIEVITTYIKPIIAPGGRSSVQHRL